ncbi:hypothetical protein [Rhodanobacter sp. DHB23]|uniref:hypothetical protein n=1 Tax=Rhodanobacter sp. DHB23 TaxID=2775923 RepID=UPI00178537DD|nr:hypothetical protein [Rhodanobacter sp. DHB23]MBD8873850.1 hypothetical protein [Rhodanobacter sp. DHB23]
MSIQTGNEVDRLFSIALGVDWIEAALLARTTVELEEVDSLASSHVENALHQIAAIGNTIGAEQVEEAHMSRLGWVVAHLAEYASVMDTMAALARELQNPKIRALHDKAVEDKKEIHA